MVPQSVRTPKQKQQSGPADAGFLTILQQDPEVHGLEFFKDGGWHAVTPMPDALTINVGDQAQVTCPSQSLP